MKQFVSPLMVAIMGTGFALAQQPTITSGATFNAASYAYPGLPGSAIAQGSIFAIFGTNMGPATLQQPSALPLPAALGGVSLRVTVNGTSTTPYLVYVSASQIGAIMPSGTPAGTGTISVTYNGATSAAIPIQVAANSVGIFSQNQKGSGPGIITNANYVVTGSNASANPGETFIIWATGLGPASGNEAAGTGTLMPLSVPMTVYVGGVSAKVAAYALSGSPGLAQIAFVVPSGVTGCNVPVTVQTGTVVSNFVTMSIAATGRTCSDPVTTTGNSDSTIPPSIIAKIIAQGYAAIGFFDVVRSSTSILSTTYTSELGIGSFTKTPVAASTVTTTPIPTTSTSTTVSTIGACSVVYESVPLTSTTPTPPSNPNPTPTPMVTPLDAGTLVLTGPNGTHTITRSPSGAYSATLGQQPALPGQTASPLFLDPGNYSFGNGSGGADVGPFSLTFTLPPALVWTNSASISTVQRSQGQLITWTGGDPHSTTAISGSSFVSTASAYLIGSFYCVAPTSDQRFTIPPYVLLTLPASPAMMSAQLASFSSLGIGSSGVYVPFMASGLDYGVFAASVSGADLAKSVTYQ